MPVARRNATFVGTRRFAKDERDIVDEGNCEIYRYAVRYKSQRDLRDTATG